MDEKKTNLIHDNAERIYTHLQKNTGVRMGHKWRERWADRVMKGLGLILALALPEFAQKSGQNGRDGGTRMRSPSPAKRLRFPSGKRERVVLTLKTYLPTEADLIAMLKVLPESSFVDARAFHRSVYAYLVAQGWPCKNEVRVGDRGDGIVGRVDIAIGDLGLELDNNVPRVKSQKKLGLFPCGGFILLRHGRKFLRIKPVKRIRSAT